MTTDFWNRVLAEYDAGDPAEWALCCSSPTFYTAYRGILADYDAINTLAGQFLTNTDAGKLFLCGHIYLFLFRRHSERTDDERVAALRAVRRDFLLWARDNDRDDNTDNLTTS